MNPNQSVIRYSGGHQVGHCVRIKNDKHIFSNFGAGTLRGLPTIWNAKTCDPVGFIREYKDIVDYAPRIWVNPMCPVTTPFDKVANVIDELTKKESHGSIGVGFGATIQREADNYHLYFCDLRYYEILRSKLDKIEEYYAEKKIFVNHEDIVQFLHDWEEMFRFASINKPGWVHEIWESSQGLMLDMDYGIFPNVTRSRVGTQEITYLPEFDEIYLVTRAYQTRHGNGYCSKHVFKPSAKDETNLNNEFQGEFKTRLLDIDLINYAMNIDEGIRNHLNKNLVITCLDHMNKYAITIGGQIVDFKTENEFIEFIIKNIPPIEKVFLSHGPTAEDITLFKPETIV
ncbi:MAG: hypothetical protein A2161_13715 [Candidatus Schekmanbacteria bacterium RBG_13_48_7]|uniref:Uncharacterized protein n=1 Tax=Candidatus Schekmanbacteria bacterium RBG_13_48_7 TaxID=1817878 RepID=A0A1F7S113_9BACT|nr:MAG: hypothetical protein A2161_13715 [Candidatus Schekmanbacteria bacterium RBG_13_48_7]